MAAIAWAVPDRKKAKNLSPSGTFHIARTIAANAFKNAVSEIKTVRRSYASSSAPKTREEIMVTAGERVAMVLIGSTELPRALSQRGRPEFDETPSACEKKKANRTRSQKRHPDRT